MDKTKTKHIFAPMIGCSTGKIGYKNMVGAEYTLGRMQNEAGFTLDIYLCRKCKQYHIGRTKTAPEKKRSKSKKR